MSATTAIALHDRREPRRLSEVRPGEIFRHRSAAASLDLVEPPIHPTEGPPGDMSVEPVPPLTAALSCAVLGAGVAGLVPPLPAVGIAVALATGVHATLLVRHAWSIHTQTHSFGPCRGSGFLGLGTLVAGTAVVAAVVLVAGGGATGPAGARILTGGLLAAVALYVL